jgi:BirA family biotin operon repressor/biotin-[acetyl-CoA-carboxylase] ligase
MVSGREWSRIELCAALLKSLDREYKNLLTNTDSHRDILGRFQERSCSVRGREVWIEEHPGLEGVTDGLDSRGFLQLRTSGGVRTVYSGTVRWK